MKAYLDIKTKGHHHREISKSFLIGFPNALVRNMVSDAIPVKGTDINGVEWDSFYAFRYMMVASPAGKGYVPSNVDQASQQYHYSQAGNNAQFMGIIIGSGNAPVTPADYNLETPISHGRTTGQLMRHGTLVSGLYVTEIGDSASFQIQSIFENRSGSNVTISEVGMICHQHQSLGTHWDPDVGDESGLCIIRDVITPVNVLDGTYARVEYSIEMST